MVCLCSRFVTSLFFSSLLSVNFYDHCCHLVFCSLNCSFAKCHLTLIKFSVHFAAWHALILTSSVLIFCSLAYTDSLAFLGHLFNIFFPVCYVLSSACFCCFSFPLVSSSFFKFWSPDRHKLLQRVPFTKPSLNPLSTYFLGE